MRRHVIVGAGLAGHRAALALRSHSRDDQIILLGDEIHRPYDRPPLSKEFLLSGLDGTRPFLSKETDYEALGVEYLSGTFVTTINRGNRTVHSSDGRAYPYDCLLLATGSRPRRLDGFEPSSRICYLRSLEDAIHLRAALAAGSKRVAVIGGGFVGLEVASVAAKVGCRVTIIEAGNRILARSMPPYVSNCVQKLHEQNGVEFLLGQKPIRADHTPNSILVQFANTSIEVDLVVVGIGILPNVELAVAAGLAVQDGIVVDRSCRTSDEAIFAAGEVTTYPATPDGHIARVESWRVASEQPAVAASTMAGVSASYDELPWLWSDQYHLNLQSVGLPNRGNTHLIVEGKDQNGWTLISADENGSFQGAVAMNRGRDITLIKRMMSRGVRLAREMFPDASFLDLPAT
ncbi:NAD(P)/FAD-dependent oxidoreductase [Bradyrhizobium sp. 1.29L]